MKTTDKIITDLQGDVIYQAGSIATAAAGVEKAKYALDQATSRLAKCNELHSRAVDALIAEMNKRRPSDPATPTIPAVQRVSAPARNPAATRKFVPDERGGQS